MTAEPHPQWAVVEATKLLNTLYIVRTYEEQIDFVCFTLRAAYHQGGRDTCDALKVVLNETD